MFTGYNNYPETDAYIGEVNGATFAADQYVFPQKDSSGNYTVVTRTIELSPAATGTITFTPQGKQVVLTIGLEGKQGGSTAISKPTADGSIIATEYYDLQGRRIENATRGVIIRVDRMYNGQKKVTKMVK